MLKSAEGGEGYRPGAHASILGSVDGMLWAFWLRPEWSIQNQKKLSSHNLF